MDGCLGFESIKKSVVQKRYELGGKSLWLMASVIEDGRGRGLRLIYDYTLANQKFLSHPYVK
jgi:hypothetical protein